MQIETKRLTRLCSKHVRTAVMLLSLCAASLTQANTLEEAKQKLLQKDYAGAHAIYLSLANQNDAKACYNLGMMSQNGDGVPKSMDEAVKWYTKSAELNYKEAQYTLGSLVFQRLTQSITYPQAVAYYAQAAQQGHVKSQLNLGMLYLRGEVIAQDMAAAVKWLSLAASNNNSEAQGYLAELYQQGAGVEQDTVKAAMWLMLATQNEDKRFINRHTKMLSYLSAQMTDEQKTAAEQLVAQCKSRQLQGC